MSTLKLHKSGAGKYVILENATTKEKILVSDERAGFHKEILRKVILETNDEKWRCLGGGRIKITTDNIHIYGYSVDFGIPNESDVKSIIDANQDSLENRSITYSIGEGY